MQTFKELAIERIAFEKTHRKIVFTKSTSTLTKDERVLLSEYNGILDKIAVLVADMNLVQSNENRSGSINPTPYRILTAEEAVQKRREAFKILTENPSIAVKELSTLLVVGIKRAGKWKKEWKSGWR